MIGLLMGLVLAAADKNKDVYDLAKEGKVSSLSTDYKGTPFGSLVPYALDAKGNPIIYISGLATHTKNLEKTPECSVMVCREDADDVFNSARVTFLGKMQVVPEKEQEAVAKVFFAKFPQAKNFAELHDFAFYRMEITKIYYIGGFGVIRWIDAKDYHEGYR
jgi:hypothetical protein